MAPKGSADGSDRGAAMLEPGCAPVGAKLVARRALLPALAAFVLVLVSCDSPVASEYREFCGNVPREAYRGSSILVGAGYHACLVEYPDRLTIRQATCTLRSRGPAECVWEGAATVYFRERLTP